MPIYEYKCTNCEERFEMFAASYRLKKKEVECLVCSSMCKPIMSKFRTSDSLMKPLSGVDDTDELTIGKLVANRGMPAESKRKERERAEKYAKGKAAYKERQERYKFSQNADED